MPRAMPVSKPVMTPTHPDPETAPHVLVVDDEELACKVVARMVRSAGYRVTATRSAHEALRLLQRPDDAIDLLLTDVIMPEMSGRDLAEAARALDPDLPLLYISAYDVFNDRAMPFGAPLLSKPFSLDELLGAVASAVGPARRTG